MKCLFRNFCALALCGALLLSALPTQALAASAESNPAPASSPARVEHAETVDAVFIPEENAVPSLESGSAEADVPGEDTPTPETPPEAAGPEPPSEVTPAPEAPPEAAGPEPPSEDAPVPEVPPEAEEIDTPPSVLATDPLVSGEFTYTLSNDGAATITGWTGSGTALSIPAQLDGHPVTAIGFEAFKGRGNLQAVQFSSQITEIGIRAFDRCGSLTAIQLPPALETLGAHAFDCCTALESVFIPASLKSVHTSFGNFGGPFTGCSGLNSVSFEDGIENIPSILFKECGGLTHIELPESVSAAGDEAFSNCINLRTVQLSAQLTELGIRSFAGCTALTAIQIPAALKTLGANAFDGCTALESVFIPASLETVQTNMGSFGSPFTGCSNLSRISFGDGIESIPARLFSGCDFLTRMEIPETVTSIGSDAFVNCANLRTVLVSNLLCTVGNSAFRNCPELTLYCPAPSFAAVYAIENGVPFQPFGVLAEQEACVLAHVSGTSLYADVNGVSASGLMTLTLTYRVKDAWAGKVSNLNAKIKLPSNVSLDEESIRLDGALCTDFTLRGETLAVPLSNSSGAIRLTVKITSQGPLTGYALLDMKKEGQNAQEVIGILNERSGVLTLDLPSETAKDTVTASGLAPASSVVALSVDGAPVVSVIASKAGSWSAQVPLPNPTDYYSYTVTASCTRQGETASQSSAVVYKPSAVTMTSFRLAYQEHGADKTCDLMNTNGIKPKVYFAPGCEFRFTAGFDHPEQIGSLYVTSTRGGEKKYLEAKYDAASGLFATSGCFDPSDKNYVPGTISVEYTKNVPQTLVGQTMDLDALAAQSGLDPAQAIQVTEDTATDYSAAVDLSGLGDELKDVLIDASISVYDESTDGSLSDWIGAFEYAEKVAEYLIEGKDGDDYLLSMDILDPYTYAILIHNLSDDTYLKLILDNALDGSEFGSSQYLRLTDLADHLSTASTVTKLLVNQYEISKEAQELREEVLSRSGLTDDQRNEALKLVDEYEFDKGMFTLMTTVLPLIAGAGISMSAAPLILLTGIIGIMTACSSSFWKLRVGQIKGERVGVSWVVDPSGYVYDLDSLDRLPDVTASAYYIPYDGTDEFWQNRPSEDEYGTLWDAREYDQENPLQTNTDGKYAWDVPEGWWRVKYEKSGYETIWSAWMTVPPLQTEVNIGMQSTEPAPYSVRLSEQTPSNAALSLTNNTARTEQIQWLAAAYTPEGRMIAHRAQSASLAPAQSTDLTLPWAEADRAALIKVFVLANGTWTPLRSLWARQLQK